MASRKNRIIVDTNLWISFLLTKKHTELDNLFSERAFILLFSQDLLDEFIEVSQRPRFKKYFSANDLQNLLLQIDELAVFTEVKSRVEICRDPKDNFLLSLAKDGEASHLITGDKDLLEIKKFGKTKILTMAEYLAEH